ENAFNRRNTVLMLMEQQGFITPEEYEEWSEVPIEDMLDVRKVPPTCATAKVSAYFCEYVVNTILQSPEYGETKAERVQLLLRGGLDITTTIDKNLQAEGWEALTNAVPVDDSSGVSNAISTVEQRPRRHLAMVQNTPYASDEQEAHPKRPPKLNFTADAAHGRAIGFQTGSTFKAFVLAPSLEAGNSLMDTVDGRPGQ